MQERERCKWRCWGMKVCKDVIHSGRVTWINGLCDWWFSWFSWVAWLCSLSGGLRIITWVWFYTVFEWMSLVRFIVWMYYLISWCVYVMVYFTCMMWWCIFCWQYVILMGFMLGVFCLAWNLLVKLNVVWGFPYLGTRWRLFCLCEAMERCPLRLCEAVVED